MTDGIVQVAPDSTGKKVDTSELTVGANTVERQRVVLADDSTAAGVARIANAIPGSTDYGLTVRQVPPVKTMLQFFAVAAAAGTTTTETAITLTKASGTSATTTGTSFVLTSGKIFRITALVFAARGNATATIQTTTFNLRINTAGAVTTTSTPVVLAARVATPATASAWDRFIVPLGTEGLEFAGNGTIQFGITAAATFTTNAPTWDVILTGYEY